MSAFGFAKGLTKSYLNNLNAGAARSILSQSWKLGDMASKQYGMRTGIMAGGLNAGRGLRNWAWGSNMAQRTARIGTAVGAVGVGGLALKARGSISRGRVAQEAKYGKMGFWGPSADQTRSMLDDAGINYR